jgi:hypothetical protein
MKTSIQADLPEDLISQARAFIEEGWKSDFSELLAEALRGYLDSHSSCITENFIREDVTWGLHGKD